MARKKNEEAPKGSPAWMTTFSDLMNLLLCFFVLLFSMSSVDSDKYETLLASISGNFSVFTSGSSMVGDDSFVASGASQMVDISDYFSEMREDGGKEGNQQNYNDKQYDAQVHDEQSQTAQNQGEQQQDSSQQPESQLERLEEQLKEEKKEQAEQLYEEISQQADDKQLNSGITIDKDKSDQYVQISIGGGILFDSAKSDLKDNAADVLSQIGDILKNYKNHLIKIEGHTDNVPITGSVYASNMQLSMARSESVFDYLVKKKKLNPVTLEPSGRGEYCPIADNSTSEGRAKNRRVEFKIYTDVIDLKP